MRQYRALHTMTLEEKEQEWRQILERLINLGADYFKLQDHIKKANAGSSKRADYSLSWLRNLEIETQKQLANWVRTDD